MGQKVARDGLGPRTGAPEDTLSCSLTEYPSRRPGLQHGLENERVEANGSQININRSTATAPMCQTVDDEVVSVDRRPAL
eukprot:5426164-Pyramimonas_sp.AAC.1